MGFGKKFKRFTGGLGKVAADLTGSKTVGKAVASNIVRINPLLIFNITCS